MRASSEHTDCDWMVPISLGPSHVCLDVTPISTDLRATLSSLQATSLSRFGRSLRVLLEPHQQMLGSLVVEAVVVRAPDNVQLRLMRRMAKLPQQLEPDWVLVHASTSTTENNA